MSQKTEIRIQNTPDKAASLFAIIEKLSSGKSADPAKISELLNVWERVNALQAKAAFDQALSEVKPKLPIIIKNNEVYLGNNRSYQYEDMATISQTIDPILAQHNLSYRFTTSSTLDTVTVTCKVSHSQGHTEEVSLTGPIDKSNRNPIQGLGSTTTYLSRYCLKAALGLAAGRDTDANSITLPQANETQTEIVNTEQVIELRRLLKKADKKEIDLCKHYRVEKIDDLLVGQYREVQKLLSKRLNSVEVVQ